MDNTFKNRMAEICGPDNVLFDEPLSRHTSFRIGGPADLFVTPEDPAMLEKVLRLCEEEQAEWTILGNGTNILADDAGYRGVVIQIYKQFSGIEVQENQVCAGAGVLLSALSSACLENALTGFEFASGIPGTVGGAVFMNAGAYGGEIRDVIRYATVYDPEKGIFDIPKEDLKLGYRTSIIKDTKMIVLSAVFELEYGDPEVIKETIADLRERRTSKQPLEYPSAGSTFKRPPGYFAGKLIQDAGLAGFTIGGAQVSEKHCGFVINTGSATAADVKALIDHITKTVQDRFGVTLEREVRYL